MLSLGFGLVRAYHDIRKTQNANKIALGQGISQRLKNGLAIACTEKFA
jgi:hypothetical protein